MMTPTHTRLPLPTFLRRALPAAFVLLGGLLVRAGAEPAKTLDLPLPDGSKMRFVAVRLGIGDGALAYRKLVLGDRRSDNFEEPLTQTTLSGTFVERFGDEADWCYYLAATEVSGQQWQSVMGSLPKLADGVKVEGDRGTQPVTRITPFEVHEFLEKWNRWLAEKQPASLPKLGPSSGFVRLPTEAEWEFAARGGTAVGGGLFDAATPYQPGTEREFERFFNRQSGKPADVGALKPNPLGLYDMLGNVMELTSASFQLEFYQGRVGGLVVRGGYYRTEPEELRASLRKEVSGFGAAAANPTWGFRPVIGSAFYSGVKVRAEVKAAWANHRRVVPGIAPIGDKVAAQVEAAERELQLLASALKSQLKPGEVDQAVARINLAKQALGTAEGIANEKEREVVASSLLQFAFTTLYWAENTNAHAGKKAALDRVTDSDAGFAKVVRTQLGELQQRLDFGRQTIEANCELLNAADASILQAELAAAKRRFKDDKLGKTLALLDQAFGEGRRPQGKRIDTEQLMEELEKLAPALALSKG